MSVVHMPSPTDPDEPQRMSADEFLRLYLDEDRMELIDGVVTHLPGTGFQKGLICANVAADIGNFVYDNRLGRVAINDTFIRTKPDAVRGADLVFVSYAVLPAEVPTPKGALAPPVELVAEVRASTECLVTLMTKATEYIAAGVQVVLIVDIESRAVAVFRANQLPQRFEPSDTLTLPDVLPGFSVQVAKLFE